MSKRFELEYAAMPKGFEVAGANGIEWVYAKSFCEAGGVWHGFTRRSGGVSAPPFDALNLGWNRDEPREVVEQNFVLLAQAMGFSRQSMALVNYEHGESVVRATAADCGKGMGNGELDYGSFEPCDALITDSGEITLVTLHADCMPVFLYDPQAKAVGIAHAGWKGVSKRIGEKTARKMIAELGCKSGQMLAALGPAISQACFEVEKPVADVFAHEFPETDCVREGDKPGKFHVDLFKAMAAQLLDAGLCARNITVSGECTSGNPDLYYSYRRDGKATGAMAGIIRLI